jgi:hypothetical protein
MMVSLCGGLFEKMLGLRMGCSKFILDPTGLNLSKSYRRAVSVQMISASALTRYLLHMEVFR